MTHNHHAPTADTEDQRGYGTSARAGVLDGPGAAADHGAPLYGLDFQLDSGNRSGGGDYHTQAADMAGAARVYELHYLPPGRSIMPLAKIYVTGDAPCHLIDRARGAWLRFEAGTEHWYVNSEALAALAAARSGGRLLFQIAHTRCDSGMAVDAVAWADVATVVAQVMPRDVAWQPHGGAAAQARPDVHLFALSPDTPAPVRARPGSLLALGLTVTREAGAEGPGAYRLSATEWYQATPHQAADPGLLFAGWRAGEGVVLAQRGAGLEGSMQYARCGFTAAG